jgi:S-adenosylhomocysteine hydrolase
VAAQLREDGFRVVGAEEPLGRVAESAVALAGDLVVLDDGGDLGIEIARLRPVRAELIESTSKGVARLLAADPDQRFLDVAGSTVKLQLSRTIAVSCVVRFREILRHERLAGERCHVVGYGRLGRHVAALLGQTGMNVTVSEILPEAREDAHNDGFPVFSSARDALRSAPHRYLFGCSGARAVGAEEVELLAGDAVLASLSSQDLRPALDWLRGHAQRRPSRGAGERYVLPGGRARTVLAYGDAINLFRAEGVSELDFDAFTALQLAAVVECARVGVARVDVGALCDEVAALQEDVLAGELA